MDLFNFGNIILSFLTFNGHHCVNGGKTSFADNSVQRRINDFREYCPYTRLCNASAKEIPQSATYSRQTSCCKSCDCGSDCGLDCCPDRSAHFESEEEMYYIKNIIKCVDAQYKSDRNGSVQSFLMVSRCPYGYSDFEIAAKCAREYSEVAFNVPLRYILPGYDKYTRLIYKNIFCARCHNVQENTLDFFSLKFTCLLVTQNVTYVNDIAQCNILFKPQNVYLYQKACINGVIRHCNVTGQWEVYDKYLEEACLSYTSVYENFRNVHCFLCNGFNASNVRPLCNYSSETIVIGQSSSFITFLDWNREQPTMLGNIFPNEATDCQQNIIFNVSKADEWLTSCPDGMILLRNTCIIPYLRLPSYIKMEINLILEPKLVLEDNSKYTVNQILSGVLKETQKVMSLLISSDLQLYKVTGVVTFNKYVSNLHQEEFNKFQMESVHSVDIKIEILKHMSYMDHVGTAVIDFALVLTNISDFGNFNARFCHFDTGYVFDDLPSAYCSPDLELHEYELCFHSPPYTIKELYFQISRTNLRMPVNMSYYTIAAELEPFCPRVALPKPLHCNESLVEHIYSNNILKRTLLENKTHLFFCYQDYFKHLDSLNVEFDEREPTPFSSTRVAFYLSIACLTASIICLVLTFTVYFFYPILRTLPGLNNMALVTSLILFQTMTLVNTVFRIELPGLCAFVGVFTHFSLILSFAWMFVCTFHMLNAFVKIRNQNVARNVYKRFLSYIAFTVGVAAAAVLIAVVVAMVHSGGSDIGYGGISCYIKKPIMIILVVAVPVAMVTLMNIVMFCVVVFTIRKLPVLASSNIQERNNIKIFVKLSTVTGMTWIFGFLYIFTRLHAFAYLFIVFNAGQGVFIMMSFICNRRVLNLVLKKTIAGTRQTTSIPL